MKQRIWIVTSFDFDSEYATMRPGAWFSSREEAVKHIRKEMEEYNGEARLHGDKAKDDYQQELKRLATASSGDEFEAPGADFMYICRRWRIDFA